MVAPKKSLGQNFLKNASIIAEIIKAADIQKNDFVLEIGPGEGALTEKLLQTEARVIAVEKDDRLIELLNQKFKEEIANGSFTLIHNDILEILPGDIGLKAGNYKLVANIPYYITGQILRNFLESNHQPAKMVLMVQKEVAERIVTRDNKESLLSISVKAFGEPKYVKTVSRGNFFPIPNVDSAILLIDNISKKEFSEISENRFFHTLKQGFAQKRKMLRGNLNLPEDILATCGVMPKARAEELSVEQWKCLTKYKKD